MKKTRYTESQTIKVLNEVEAGRGVKDVSGRMSSIIGPMLWGTIVLLLENTRTLKYRAAIFALWLITLTAILLFRPLARRLAARQG